MPAATARGQVMTPMPRHTVSCNDEYLGRANAYWPVVGDIMRFDAMFRNYASLCAKADPRQMQAIQPFVAMMSRRAQADVDDSYDVMERVIRNHLPEDVPDKCSNDTSAQDYAVRTLDAAMDAQRAKAGRRLDRSAKDIDPAQTGEICHSLTAIRDDIANHVSDRSLDNPLFEIAFLRGRALRMTPAEARVYNTYRQVLDAMHRGRAQRGNNAKPRPE